MSNGKELQKNIRFLLQRLLLLWGQLLVQEYSLKYQTYTEVTGTAGMALFVWFLGGMHYHLCGLTAAELAAAMP